ncbi:hypothetical protein ABKA04_001399 [Annulohypoxylon sp. FPYF3050]
MLPFVLLLLPLFVLAAPSAQGELESRSTPIKPKPPGNFVSSDNEELPIGYQRIDATYKAVAIDGKLQSLCGDCIQLEDNVVNRNGAWHVTTQTKLEDENDWGYLGTHGTCTLLFKNTAPTTIGNGDAAYYMGLVYVEACEGVDSKQFEARTQFLDPAGTRIDFWIRSTAGLDLSLINP